MILFYDLETTGLLTPARRDLPGIIQIAAILAEPVGKNGAWKEQEVFETRVNPEIKAIEWQDGAIKTTGIGPDQVEKDWPSFFEVFPEFASLASSASVLAGFNIEHFDDDVLFNNLVRYGFEKHFPWPMHRLDVMKLSRAHHTQQGKRGNKDPKLGELYKDLFDEELEGAHDALVDVRATVRCAFEIASDEIARLI